MTIKFYAVDWQLPKKVSSTGKAKNIREAMFKNDNELDNFVNNIKFDACASGNNDDLQKKFRNAISNLENVETNGNNTDILYYVLPSIQLKYKILTNKIRLDCGTVLRSGRFLTHRRVSC